MAKVFKTMIELQNHMQKAITKAVENASERVLQELQNYIMEDYYNLYQPEYYVRTKEFYKSAVAKMLNSNSAEIGISELYMSYQYSANYRLQDNSMGHWTGEDQVYMADAGFHGNAYIYRDGHFWKDFEQWCDENAVNILREELQKQGIKTIK